MSPQNVRRSPARSVFLVDDDSASADVYSMGLRAAGFEVTVHSDGPALFRALDAGMPDIVVLDWRLPGMLGDEILSRMRRDSRTRMLPVFILSNFPSTTDGVIDRIFANGALAWLEKVNTPPSLLAQKLKEALGADLRGGLRRRR